MELKPIDRAKLFLNQHVFDPALADNGLDEKTKNVVRNSKRWVKYFERVGDLITYLKRFKNESGGQTVDALRKRGLTTFEDIQPQFEDEYSLWASDRTTPESFVVGHAYSSFRILTFVGVYDTRAGGMFVLGSDSNPQAVVIKATLQGGSYPNEWLVQGEVLKYYLKSRNGVFGEHFQENAAILKNPHLHVLCFVRKAEGSDFCYQGVYESESLHVEGDGSKWFRLKRQPRPEQLEVTVDKGFEDSKLQDQVKAARTLDAAQLAERVKNSPKLPKQILLQSVGFVRSPFVIETVLRAAGGTCQRCEMPAPFSRASDGTPYLEVHHIKRLADGGEDTVENAIAICPNCHREMHYGVV